MAESRRLNRTSVGLKLDIAVTSPPYWNVPQSNQRGIETSKSDVSASSHPFAPQSNQRGIETSGGRARRVEDAPRLNRTSVGLKQICDQDQDGNPGPGLNRTSVGLKPLCWNSCFQTMTSASIEPAWD